MRNFDRSPPPRRLAMGKIGSLGLWVYSRSSLQLGFGALLLAVAPKSHAMIPFGVALSAASSVANMIGSQNQGDGGLAATMKATLEYQRIISKQLLDVQEGLTLVLRRIEALEGAIREMFKQQRVIELQSAIGTQIRRYEHEITSRASSFVPYEAWMRDVGTRNTLGDIANRLEDAVTQVEQNRWLDAMTALYLCSAAFAGIGVRAALGEQNPQLMAEAQRYLDIFALFTDPMKPDSLSSAIASSPASIATISKDILDRSGISALPAADTTTAVNFGGIVVQAPLPPMDDSCLPRGRECRSIDFHEFDVRSQIGASYYAEQSAKDGGVEVLQYTASPAQAVRIKTHSLTAAELGRAYANGTYPEHAQHVFGETMVDPQQSANASPLFIKAKAQMDETIKSVDKLNIANGTAALDGVAMVAILATRQRLLRHFDKGG